MLIASAKIPEGKRSISPSSFNGQLPDYQSHVLALSTQQMSSSSCWCKSKELGGRESPIFPCVTPVVFKLLLRPSSSYNKLLGKVALRTLSNIHDGALLRKQQTTFNTLIISAKVPHRIFSTRFKMFFRLQVLQMWVVGRQTDERRIVMREKYKNTCICSKTSARRYAINTQAPFC